MSRSVFSVEIGPILVECALVGTWEAHIVTLDADGQPVPVRDQPCNP